MNRRQTRENASKTCPKCGHWAPTLTQHGHCYECDCVRRGKKRVEDHHPFGRAIAAYSAMTVTIPANIHRELHTKTNAMPPIVERPGADPLNQVAAVVYAIGKAAMVFAAYAKDHNWPEWTSELAGIFATAATDAASWLLILAGKLDERIGPDWADELGMPSWP